MLVVVLVVVLIVVLWVVALECYVGSYTHGGVGVNGNGVCCGVGMRCGFCLFLDVLCPTNI